MHVLDKKSGDRRGTKWDECSFDVEMAIEFFMISAQHKNGNITNFVLVMPFKILNTYKFYYLEKGYPFYQLTSYFTFIKNE